MLGKIIGALTLAMLFNRAAVMKDEYKDVQSRYPYMYDCSPLGLQTMKDDNLEQSLIDAICRTPTIKATKRKRMK